MTDETRWVRCREPFVDREFDNARRAHGDEWQTSPKRARGLAGGGLVVLIDEPGGDAYEYRPPDPWRSMEGRDLRTADEAPAGWRIVACLNVWNDADALRQTIGTWLPHVDRVIVVDGAYAGAPVDVCASTDDTVDVLREAEDLVVIDPPEGRFWEDQIEKRNAYMGRLEPGDLAFVVDADEFVEGAEALRQLGPLEVGWVPYRKAIYRKDQNFPRLFSADIRPRYGGRHYWIEGERGFVTDCQRGGPDYDHAFVPVRIDNTRGRELRTDLRWSHKGAVQRNQFERESKVGEHSPGGRESMRIVQLTSLDPGMVVYRLHSAVNSTTPHTSVMGATNYERVYDAPMQYHCQEDRAVLREALASCDLIHCHLSYHRLDSLGVRTAAPVLMHHHGTLYRTNANKRNLQDDHRADVRLVSNPELLGYGEDLHYLPNPVPVRRYRRLREQLWSPDPDGWIRVGHSPSKRALKGTEQFLEAVERLRAGGVRIRPVLIEDVSHAESIRRKAAECDLFFDSFWLGMQCSGLEAGAMGIPVIAGDPDVRAWHEGQRWGVEPYVYANDGNVLEEALANLAADEEAQRLAGLNVLDYVTRHHDYAAVTGRYLDILQEELNWIGRLGLGGGGTRFLTREG